MEQKITPPLTKGILISLILIILSLAIYFLNIDINSPAKYIAYIILIAGIIWSVSSFGKQNNYNSTFGNYFSHGFKITAIVTLLMILFTVIFVLLFPDIKANGMVAARKKMEADGRLTTDQINQYLILTGKLFMVYIIAFILISYLFVGAVASLIGAGVTKKEPHPEGEINQIK